MKDSRSLFLILFVSGLFLFPKIFAADPVIRSGNWEIRFEGLSGTFDFLYLGKPLLKGVYGEAKFRNAGSGDVFTVKSKDYPNVTFSETQVSDAFGSGKKYSFLYTSPGSPNLEHCIYTYEGLPYFLMELYISDDHQISTNHLAPMVSETSVAFLPNSTDNRMLMVPYDNDGWVKYESNTLTQSMTSFEATAVFNGESRNGLVLGSVEHNNWKNGFELTASNNEQLDKIRCFSGITHALTRDIQADGTSREHGYISGLSVKSAKMFVGFFDDWRKGLECFGQANTKVVPRRVYNGGTPFGWNSWGVMAQYVSYAGVQSVSQFYKDQLFGQGFQNDSVVWISLDSFYGDNMTNFQVKKLIADCKARGQNVGTYWGPFSEWSGNENGMIPGSTYTNGACYLRVNGVPRKLDGAWCMDPTHPGVKAHIDYQLEKFKSLGFKYIKLDFMTHGALEADSHYDPAVTTGTQAYNQGMQYLIDKAGNDFFLTLSISPAFPYQYGNARRISCDAWSDIGSTQYVMNCLSYGWWLNQVYQFNDPDHLVMVRSGTEAVGVNRARITSGAITGLFIFGDNFSDNGPYVDGVEVGYPSKSRERALLLMTNKDIQEIARMGRSFMPVEGYKASYNGAENLFMYHTDDYLYVACINYSNRTLYGTIPLDRLQITASEVDSIKDLWTGAECTLQDGGLYYQVPFTDARIYRITKKKALTSLNKIIEVSAFSIYPVASGEFGLSSQKPIKEVSIFNIQGRLLETHSLEGAADWIFSLESFPRGIYLIQVRFEDGRKATCKMVI